MADPDFARKIMPLIGKLVPDDEIRVEVSRAARRAPPRCPANTSRHVFAQGLGQALEGGRVDADRTLEGIA